MPTDLAGLQHLNHYARGHWCVENRLHWAGVVDTYRDLGANYHESRIDKERRKGHLVQQLEALGLRATLTPAAA